jgi:hypothetical protein
MLPLNVKAAANFVLDITQVPAQYVIQMLVAVNDSDGNPVGNLGNGSFVVTDFEYEALNPLESPLVVLSVQNIYQDGNPSAFYKVRLTADQTAQAFPNVLLITVFQRRFIPVGVPGQPPSFTPEVIGQGTAVTQVSGLA